VILNVSPRIPALSDFAGSRLLCIIRQSDFLGPRPGLICAVYALVLIGLVITGMVFGEILEHVRGDGWLGTDTDIALSGYAAAHRTGWLTTAMRQVTDLGGTVALTAVVFSTITGTLILKRYSLAVMMLVAGIGSSTLTVSMKTMIDRPRPLTNGDLAFASGPSFPSGHTLESMAIYGALVFIIGSLIASPRIRLGVWGAGAILAFAIGASRVYLGVHWASDVVAGWMLGFALIAGIAGLIALDQRVIRFLRSDSRGVMPRIRALGTRGSILAIVGLTVVTAFIIGVQFEV
jgi:membrane-associated phospholipid phosphatase